MKKLIVFFLILFFGSIFISCNTKQELEDSSPYLLTHDSVKVWYVDKGDPTKTPVIFLQGSDGTSFEWQKFTERLKKKYRLILFDRRGMGKSSRLLPDSKLSMKLYLDDILALQKKLGIDKAAILGWSFGGAVAAEYALQYPEKVSSVVLCNPLSDSKQLWKDRAKAVEPIAIQNHDTLALNTIDKLNKGLDITIDDEYELVKLQNAIWYDHKSGENFYKTVNIETFGYNDSTIRTDWQNVIAQKKIYDGYSNLNRISKIACPVLIIGGTHDGIVSPEQCKKIHSLIPSSKLNIIEKCGHLPFIERPDELEKVLTDFIK